jgi:hypothetical protein
MRPWRLTIVTAHGCAGLACTFKLCGGVREHELARDGSRLGSTTFRINYTPALRKIGRKVMKTLAITALGSLALLTFAAAPSQAWQALVDDDSVLINRPNEHWFRGPDGRLHPRVTSWAGYGAGGFFGTRSHKRKHRPVRAEPRSMR